MRNWIELQLNRPASSPIPSTLVALRMTPTASNPTFHKSESYDIGKFQLDPSTGRKMWWHGTHGCQDPVKMKNHYTIWWSAISPFDGL